MWVTSHRCLVCVVPQGAPCGSARACAVSYPVTVQQGLLFVKPTPLPNPVKAQQQQQQHAPLDQLIAGNGSSAAAAAPAGGGATGAASSQSLQQQQQQRADAGVDLSDVPLVPEIDEPDWVAQVRGSAC